MAWSSCCQLGLLLFAQICNKQQYSEPTLLIPIPTYCFSITLSSETRHSFSRPDGIHQIKPTIDKVEKILKGRLDSVPSPSPSVKIQIMGRKVCLRRKGKTLLGIVNKNFVFKSLLTTSSNVLPLQLSLKVMRSYPGYLLKSFLLYFVTSKHKGRFFFKFIWLSEII